MACPDKKKDSRIIAEYKRRKKAKSTSGIYYETILIEGGLEHIIYGLNEDEIQSFTREENGWNVILKKLN